MKPHKVFLDAYRRNREQSFLQWLGVQKKSQVTMLQELTTVKVHVTLKHRCVFEFFFAERYRISAEEIREKIVS